MGIKARIKSGKCPFYLKENKWYDVTLQFGERSGRIITENNERAFICFDYSYHLMGGSWEVIEVDDV